MSLIMKNGEAYGKGGGGDVSGRAMSTAIAPEFDPSESYVIGDKVMHEDEYYVFTADHTGAWDDADVDPTDVDSEIPKAMSDDDLDDVKDAFVPNTGAPLRMMNYSTEEQIVGTWIDGKPLYQKTVTVNITAGAAKSTKDYTLTTDTTYELRGMEGLLVRTGGNGVSNTMDSIAISQNDGTVFYAFYLFQDAEKNIILRQRAYVSFPNGGIGYITVRYTKTTD